MKNITKTMRWIFVVMGVLWTGSVVAQNYEQLFDYSGEPNTDYINQLNEAADSLVAAFPTEYQNQFKVYDFGFYLHQEDYDGFSYPDEFVEVVRDLESPYYLVFGRQTDGDGVNSKVWVEVKLPDEGCFELINEEQRGMIHSRLVNAVNGGDNRFVSEAQAIDGLTDFIAPIITCCEAERNGEECDDVLNMSNAELYQYLEDKGYKEFQSCKIDIVDFYSQDPLIKLDFEYYGTTYETIYFKDELESFTSSVEGETPLYLAFDISDGIPSNFTAPDVVTNSVYKEHVLMLNTGEVGENGDVVYKVFYKISTTLMGTELWDDPAFTEDEEGNKRVVVAPAIWLLKRAAMGGIEVLMEIGIYWAMEKYISDCPWGDAWGQLKLNYWSLMASFFVGASGSNSLDYIKTLFEPLVTYLLTGQLSRGLGWDDAGIAIAKGMKGAVLQAAFGKVFKGFGKVTSKAGREEFGRQIGELVTSNKIVQFSDDLMKMGIDNLHIFVTKPGRVKAWKAADDLAEGGQNAFKQLKKDSDFIKKFDDVIDDLNLNNHLFKGDPKYIDGRIRDFSGVHSGKNLVTSSQTTGNQGDIRIQLNTKVDLGDGYYTAKVQMFGKKGDGQSGGFIDGWLKGKRSTFFPDNWSKTKIQAEIARGIKNKTPDPNFPVSNGKIAYQAIMSDGKRLQMIFDGNKLISAFPNL